MATIGLISSGGWPALGVEIPVDTGEVAAQLPYAQFKIPFNVEARGNQPVEVQLWVSTDEGKSWQKHSAVPAAANEFEFRAAAEGVYWFKVHTLDAEGSIFPSTEPPLAVRVDTTKPRAALKADLNSQGQLIVDVRVMDENLDLDSAVLRMRTDREASWNDIAVDLQQTRDHYFEGQATVELPSCREVALVLAVRDYASNEGEATYQYTMPRTAAADREMTLASRPQLSRSSVGTITAPQPQTSIATAKETSQAGEFDLVDSGDRLAALPGAMQWKPSPARNSDEAPANEGGHEIAGRQAHRPGQLASDLQLSPPATLAPSEPEELPLPQAMPAETSSEEHYVTREELLLGGESQDTLQNGDLPRDMPRSSGYTASDASTIGRAYHCNSRAFSLDYSVQALGGSSLADVELWGTEDGGRSWEKWGSDPDRQSPFEVQVGNDGLFGFRMVIVSANGLVSNRPREGDSADVWINVDTNAPVVRITRAVYGEGPEDGMLVIDYTCEDGHLVERPITLSYSERSGGPWTTVATGLANTGIYLWKADPVLPDKIYLKIECVDKAGNVGSHRLDLPIDVRGLAPRGIIQGFRPITVPGP